MTRKRTLIFGLLSVFVLLAAACGGGGESAAPASSGSVTGNAADGESLYTQNAIGSAPGCTTCHSLEEGVVVVGPSHAGIGARAGSVVPGLSAEEYLRQSIVEPDAHVTEGFTAGIMYQNYGKELTEQQIADLVAFLLTQK